MVEGVQLLHHGALFCWFHLADVKGGMDAKGPGQAKPDRCRADESGDWEWTDETWCLFSGGDLKVKVLS